ncbi:hypothetical protein WKR88_10260 [Trinickia caryophylli]|uniref:Uncharacterized protein n=1 Tax=Trinickia caryophylli TaxID=28094 RepID=A0A1X7ESS8_TRICW|nr:hypothetical protein [Trinickia caryophylli]TRX18580.1 hypothetical protein FNF07_10375 [Trinickia caryophylli]WQE10625.1 hypothetical protein U0034_12550 [Trinickia caryophylli]GLU32992.1 hypothetical protein Busp01_28340 [Trinickia caryophylli]SMF39459.1 hypothetical protein SAMN06295900_106246 [Trinickia caryophylli]
MRPVLLLLLLLFGFPGASTDARACVAVPTAHASSATSGYRYASPTERNVVRAASGVVAKGGTEEAGECLALRASMTDATILRDQEDMAVPGVRAQRRPPVAANPFGKRARLESRYRQLGCR